MKIGSIEFRPAQIGIIVLTLLTALIHFSLAQPLFILNGLGYLALLAAYFLPWSFLQRWHRVIRWLFAGYILLTIVLFFLFNADGSWQNNWLGLITKLIEVILLLLLAYDGRDEQVKEYESA